MTSSPHGPQPPHSTSRSPRYLDALSLSQLYGPLDRSVFFHGPVGAGKTTLARATHDLSGRKGGFVPVSAADLPEALYNDVLFGHRRGAFTGANADRSGIITLAAGGTLLIDDMAFLSTVVQAAILRVVETGAYRPLGANRDSHASCRFMFASTTSLSRMIDDGHLIPDLASRIGEMTVPIPGLADRRCDIIPLVKEIARRFVQELDSKAPVRIGKEARRLLLAYSWPGNLRELTGVVERAIVHAGIHDDAIDIRPEHLPERFRATLEPSPQNEKPARRPLTREIVRDAVVAANGNKSEAARKLGVHRNTIAQYLKGDS